MATETLKIGARRFRIDADPSLGAKTVTNQGPGTLYYHSQSDTVSTTVYEGTLTTGQTLALIGTQHFVSDATSQVFVVTTPANPNLLAPASGGGLIGYAAMAVGQSVASSPAYNSGSPVGKNAANVNGLELPLVIGDTPVILEAHIPVQSGVAGQLIAGGIWDRDAPLEIAREAITIAGLSAYGKLVIRSQPLVGDGVTQKIYVVKVGPYTAGTGLTLPTASSSHWHASLSAREA